MTWILSELAATLDIGVNPQRSLGPVRTKISHDKPLFSGAYILTLKSALVRISN